MSRKSANVATPGPTAHLTSGGGSGRSGTAPWTLRCAWRTRPRTGWHEWSGWHTAATARPVAASTQIQFRYSALCWHNYIHINKWLKATFCFSRWHRISKCFYSTPSIMFSRRELQKKKRKKATCPESSPCSGTSWPLHRNASARLAAVAPLLCTDMFPGATWWYSERSGLEESTI